MKNTVNNAVLIRLKELMKEKNITRYRLAMNSGVPHSTLKNIFNGVIDDNYLSTVILLAGGLDMKVSEFLDSELFEEENLKL